MQVQKYDIAIIGGGLGGVAAALACLRQGRKGAVGSRSPGDVLTRVLTKGPNVLNGES